jgi:hypothetical protein|tara:strand:- start:667 stop:849 length:183 start_codon:yes stop_codon:yes gene_type:complete
MSTKGLIGLAIDMQGVSLAKHNVDLAKKKNIKPSDMIKGGTTNIVGIELLRAQSALKESF